MLSTNSKKPSPYATNRRTFCAFDRALLETVEKAVPKLNQVDEQQDVGNHLDEFGSRICADGSTIDDVVGVHINGGRVVA